jgi:hypothetical protein
VTRWLGGALVAILAAWARLARMQEVAASGTVLPMDGDSAYHFRRITETAAHWPHVPYFDPLMNWPHGGASHWAPGFDFLIATFARSDTAIATAPVVLGVIGVLVGMAVARRLGGSEATVLCAGLFLALLPQLVSVGRFARVDHHVAEVLVMAALAAWTLDERRGWRWEIAGAAIIAGGLLVFTGSTLYVALALAMLAVQRASFDGVAAAIGGALLAAAFVPTEVAGHGHAWSYVFPSWLQPALVALGGIGLAVSTTFRRGRGRAAMVPVIVLLAIVPFIPEVRAGIAGWLFHQDPWLASIGEFQPFYRNGWWYEATYEWGALGPLAIVLVPLGVATVWRGDPVRGRAFAVWTVAIVALTILQDRFGRIFCVNLAVASAFALEAVARRFQLALAALIAIVDPSFRSMVVPAPAVPVPAVAEALLELRAFDGEGVLAPWDDGHLVLWLARKPVVSTGFGSFLDARGFEEERAAWDLPEDALGSWMEARRLDFVLGGATVLLDKVGPAGGHVFALEGDTARLNPVFLKNVPLGRSAVGGSGIADAGVPQLGHFAPIVTTTSPVEGFGLTLPAVWVLRRVAGAVLTGQAEPGERVVLHVPLDTAVGVVVWEGWADADAGGRFAIRDPIADDAVVTGFRIGRGEVIRRAGTTEVAVSREAVERGSTIALP